MLCCFSATKPAASPTKRHDIAHVFLPSDEDMHALTKAVDSTHALASDLLETAVRELNGEGFGHAIGKNPVRAYLAAHRSFTLNPTTAAASFMSRCDIRPADLTTCDKDDLKCLMTCCAADKVGYGNVPVTVHIWHKATVRIQSRWRESLHTVPRACCACQRQSPWFSMKRMPSTYSWSNHRAGLKPAKHVLTDRRVCSTCATSHVRIQAAWRDALKRVERNCPICLESVPWATMASTVPSKRCHRVCPACASRYVDTALSDGRLYVTCPGEGCKHLMERATVCRLASVDALAQFEWNQRTNHDEKLASAALDPKMRAFFKLHARKCPGCHVIIYRSQGCDSMNCRCGTAFNWRSAEAQISFSTACAETSASPSPPADIMPPKADPTQVSASHLAWQAYVVSNGRTMFYNARTGDTSKYLPG